MEDVIYVQNCYYRQFGRPSRGWLRSRKTGHYEQNSYCFLKMIADSFKYPVVGYAGTWVGSKLARKVAPDYEVLVVLASATIANFSAELGQSKTIADEGHKNFLAYSQLFETMKDYVFALGGCALLTFQSCRAKELN